MAGRITEHPEQGLTDGILDARCTQRQHLTLGGIRLVDLDVQMNLL